MSLDLEKLEQQLDKSLNKETAESLLKWLLNKRAKLTEQSEGQNQLQVMPNEVLAGGKDGCPCLYTVPCSDNCSCAHPYLSGGCSRCAKYGSEEQRKSAAEYLAKVIDASWREA